MDEITFSVLKVIVSVCAALITVYVLPYLKELRNDKRYEQVIDMIYLAVRAAEQTIGSGQGSLKKAEVTKFVSDWLSANGIKITDDQLSQMIESCVYQLKQEK